MPPIRRMTPHLLECPSYLRPVVVSVVICPAQARLGAFKGNVMRVVRELSL
jgi:hypothetical protein